MASANYIAGYVTKKMSSVSDERLQGRRPEFARMSLKPGIGAHAMEAVALALMRWKLDRSMKDVPTSLRHGSDVMRLGRYLRRKLREKIGRDPSCPVSFGEEELRLVRSYAFCVDKSVSAVFAELAGSSSPYQERGSL